MVLVPIRSWSSVTSEDFIPPSRQEVIQEQKHLLEVWEPASEVRPLIHGSSVMALNAAVTGVIVNGLFRAKLKLHTKGIFVTNLASMGIPALMTGFLHDYFITENLLMYKNQCSLCYELRAGLILNSAALLFPLVTIPWLNLGVAASVGLRVPYLYDLKELVKFWWGVVKPASTQLSVLFAINTFTSSFVTYKQVLSMEIVSNILLDMTKASNENELTNS